MLERMAETYEQVHARAPRGTPKYLNVCQTIELEISTGRLVPGDRLPSELGFANALPISLGTVQKALGNLAGRGVLVRRHGHGTFVAEPHFRGPALWHMRMLDEFGEVLPVNMRVHEITRTEQRGAWTRFLGEQPFYVRIRRTIEVNCEFTAFGEFVVPGPRFAQFLGLSPEQLSGRALRGELAERFGVSVLRVRELIGCEPAPQYVWRHLQLAPDTQMLVCEIFGYGFRDEPVYYQRNHIPPTSRRLEVLERHPAPVNP